MNNSKGKFSIWEYLFPSSDPKLTISMDRRSMRSISNVCLVASIFETLSIIIFVIKNGFRIGSENLPTLYSVIFCAVFSFVAIS